MTEREWLVSQAPRAMLSVLMPNAWVVSYGGRVTKRTLRLFGCACLRAAWNRLTDERCRRAVEVGERFADGRASADERKQAEKEVAEYLAATTRDLLAVAASWSVVPASGNVAFAAEVCAHNARCVLRGPKFRAVQANLLRCIFGNPFQPPPAVSPGWLKWENGVVQRVARGIYEERAFDRMGILADALEDAGCQDADLLGHLRQRGEHARGCWVLDLLLNRG